MNYTKQRRQMKRFNDFLQKILREQYDNEIRKTAIKLNIRGRYIC